MGVSGERAFGAEGTANAQSLGQEQSWCLKGRIRTSGWDHHEHKESQKMLKRLVMVRSCKEGMVSLGKEFLLPMASPGRF